MEFIYDQMRNGASKRAIGRALKAKLSLTGSENSIAQSVAKLRKRTLSLMGPDSSSSPLEPAQYFQQADDRITKIPPETELDTIKRVESSYGALIEPEVAKAQSNGLNPSDLAKHVEALAELSKVRHRLEKAPHEKAWPGMKTAEDLEMERQSNLVLTHLVGDDGPRMIRGAQKFLEHMSSRVIEMDPETGEILSPKKP